MVGEGRLMMKLFIVEEVMARAMRWMRALALVVGLSSPIALFGAEAEGTQGLTPAGSTAATPTTVSSTAQDFELEKLRLEKEKLQLEIEKLKLQSATGAVAPAIQPAQGGVWKSAKEAKRAFLDQFLQEYSERAKEVAQQRKDEGDLLVLDFMNAEVWYRGTRYGIHEWEMLVGNQEGWKLGKDVLMRDATGKARVSYECKNVTLLRYDGRKRGILTFLAPASDGDFRMVTPEGLSFESRQEDLRNAFKNEYLEYEGQKRNKGQMTLRYKRKMSWQFADKLEVRFDVDGKMRELRYGVLDER